MDSIRDEYMKFNVDDDNSSNSFMSTLIKALVVLLLLLAVIVLGAIAYKFLFKDENIKIEKKQDIISKQELTRQQNSNVEQQVVNAAKKSNLQIRQEEIAAITKAVLEQLKQQQASLQKKQVQSNNTTNKQPLSTSSQTPTEIDDATLLSDLQSSGVDSTKNEEVDLSGLDEITNKKVTKSSTSKKTDTFNKVVIDKNKVATKDDLAKIYEKLNSIMQKDQAKAKESNYTKMISSETKVRANEMRIIVVKKGDTLSKIAKRAYGDAMLYNKIFEANPDILKNPNLIYVGQKLRVPK